jgi:hypothetical protein
MPTLADFSPHQWKAKSLTLAVFLINLELLQLPLESVE